MLTKHVGGNVVNSPLRKIRTQSGATQKDIAEALDIDQGHYSRIERGEVQPAIDLARRISAHFQGRITAMEIIDPVLELEEQKAS